MHLNNIYNYDVLLQINMKMHLLDLLIECLKIDGNYKEMEWINDLTSFCFLLLLLIWDNWSVSP